ncbi:MAG: class I SAM-dependent methyltransferase [Chloroflexota bacterium]
MASGKWQVASGKWQVASLKCYLLPASYYLRSMNRPNFFRPGSPFLNHPLLTAERTAAEIDFVLAQLQLPAGARILDVGCGFGRHTIELARRGYQAVGIDPSAAMVAAAQARAAEAGVIATFQQVGGHDFVTDAHFDGALCLFTTLGQISETGDNSRLVEQVYAALRPGGRFIVEVPQRQWLAHHLRPADRFDGPVRHTLVTRHFEAADNTVTEIFDVVSPQDRQRFILRYRLYDRDELVALLEAAGFTALAVYGRYAADPLTADSPIMVVVAVK